MTRPPLTIEEQKDYVRRYIKGCEEASRLQEEEARGRTDEEKWAAANRVLGGWSWLARRRTDTSGLVEQQRLFARLHRR